MFVVRDEQLLTPPLDTPVLPGITRAAVMELAVEHDIPVREQALTLDDVLAAEEVFLTNSMIELVPVVRVGRDADRQRETRRRHAASWRLPTAN